MVSACTITHKSHVLTPALAVSHHVLPTIPPTACVPLERAKVHLKMASSTGSISEDEGKILYGVHSNVIPSFTVL
jgi:hypothetical protein